MASHYLFEPEFCNPASGWEKGQVEKNVQDARRRLWQLMPSFPDIDALNAWLEEQCIAQWSEIQHGGLPGTVADVNAAEVGSLMPLGRPFDGFVEHTKRVSPVCLIHFERNRYSVPASFANRPVSVRIYPERIVVAAEGQVLCEHSRIIERSHHLTDGKATPASPIDAPQALRLAQEPLANVERYDALRDGGLRHAS